MKINVFFIFSFFIQSGLGATASAQADNGTSTNNSGKITINQPNVIDHKDNQSTKTLQQGIPGDVAGNNEKQRHQVAVNKSAADIIYSDSNSKHAHATYLTPSFCCKADDPCLFDYCTNYFASIYSTLPSHDNVVKSLKETGLNNNYISSLGRILQESTPHHSKSDSDLIVTRRDGTRIKVDRMVCSDIAAVYCSKDEKSIRVPLSELTTASQNEARLAITDNCFKHRCKISVDDHRGHAVREWIENAPSESTKQWFKDNGDPDDDWLREAGISRSHCQYQYDILLSNKSDVPLDNLIIEYQVFFSQEVAGLHKDMNKYHRFVGYSTIGEIPARGNYRLTVMPPYMTESHLVSSSTTYKNDSYTYDLSYSKDCHQKSSGRMQGIWVRAHRISPNGCITTEKKKNIYPKKTTWDAVTSL